MTLPVAPLQYFDRQGRLQNLGPSPDDYSVVSALEWIQREYSKLALLLLTQPAIPSEKLICQFDALTAASQRGQIACRLEWRRRDEESRRGTRQRQEGARIKPSLSSLESLL